MNTYWLLQQVVHIVTIDQGLNTVYTKVLHGTRQLRALKLLLTGLYRLHGPHLKLIQTAENVGVSHFCSRPDSVCPILIRQTGQTGQDGTCRYYRTCAVQTDIHLLYDWVIKTQATWTNNATKSESQQGSKFWFLSYVNVREKTTL